jgi:putative endonuclease
MANHNQTIGKEGEEIAAKWLVKNGFELKERNWRFSYSEVDIIAFKDGVLHFVEVKTRTSYTYGNPEESINSKKFKMLQRAAVAYLEKYEAYTKIQFDIIAININLNEETAIFYIDDYFLK